MEPGGGRMQMVAGDLTYVQRTGGSTVKDRLGKVACRSSWYLWLELSSLVLWLRLVVLLFGFQFCHQFVSQVMTVSYSPSSLGNAQEAALIAISPHDLPS